MLDVVGDARFADGNPFISLKDTSDDDDFIIEFRDSTNSLVWSLGDLGNDRFDFTSSNGLNWIFNGGNVGIGDTSPDAMLEIATSSTNPNYFMISEDDDGDGNIFIVDSSGNVGIGDTTPDYKLEVLDTSTQLTLTYVDGTETRFFTDVNGDLHIEPTGGDVFMPGTVSLPNLTEGSVVFAGTGGQLSQDNTNFYWDNTNKRLGIGDTTPDASLEIVTNGDNPVFMISRGIEGDGDFLNMDAEGNLNIDSDTFYVDASTNRVGIGTTSPITNTNLHIKGVGNQPLVIHRDYNAIGGDVYAVYALDNDIGETITYGTVGVKIIDNTDGGEKGAFVFKVRNGAAGFGEIVRIDNDGNIGIGDTTPDAMLEIATSSTSPNYFMISEDDDGDGNILQVNGTNGNWYVGGDGNTNYFTRTGANYLISSGSGGYFNFIVNGASPSDANAVLMLQSDNDVIIPNGNIGIGDTDPDAVLEIVTSGLGETYLMVSSKPSTDGDIFIIDSNGDIGINDTTPDYKLEVLDTITQFAITNVDGTNWTEFYVDSSGNLNIDASGGTSYVHGALSINDIYTFPIDDGSSSQFLQTDGSGTLSWATSSGSGDITDVGDCSEGACFGGAATGGTQLTFYNAGGNGVLSYNGVFNFDKNVGINDSGADYPLEIISTATHQLALAYTDDSASTSFEVDSNGDLTILPTGGDVDIDGNLIVGGGTATPRASLTVSEPDRDFVGLDDGYAAIIIKEQDGGTGSDYGIGWERILNTIIAGIEPSIVAGNDTHLDFYNTQTGTLTLAMRLNETGAVGIRDSTPDAALEVVSISGKAGFMISDQAGTDGDIFIIDSNGDVGINDTTPDYKLEVLDTITQFAITNVDGTNWTEFYVDSSGNLNIDASGGTSYVHGTMASQQQMELMDNTYKQMEQEQYLGQQHQVQETSLM
jgi:hypothetical protein